MVAMKDALPKPAHDDWPEPCEQFTQRISFQLRQGNFEQARDLIEEAGDALRRLRNPPPPPTYEQVLEMPLAMTELSQRIINGLEEEGIYTVRQCLNKTPDELVELPNFGEKTVQRIQRVLGGLVNKTIQKKAGHPGN